jgi:hypothetical protein
MNTGYYGKNGLMTDGWDTEEEAQEEFEEFYKNETDDVDGSYLYRECEIIEKDGKWVIAY